MTLGEVARRIGMVRFPEIGRWFHFNQVACFDHELRVHLLSGDRPLRIAAKVLREWPYSYGITSIPGKAPIVHISVMHAEIGSVYSDYHPDEPTAILAAAAALPPQETP